jgi:hypothetical protein
MCLILACAPPENFALPPGESVEKKTNGTMSVCKYMIVFNFILHFNIIIFICLYVCFCLLIVSPNRYDRPSVNDEQLRKFAKQIYFRYGNKIENIPTISSSIGGIVSSSSGPVSGKLFGLSLYMSRLLRGVWDWTIVVSNNDSLMLRFTRNDLIELQGPLKRLQLFVHENERLYTSYENIDFQHLKNEKLYFNNLIQLLDLCIETFNLLIMLANINEFNEIIAKLKENEMYILRESKFYDLVKKKICIVFSH